MCLKFLYLTQWHQIFETMKKIYLLFTTVAVLLWLNSVAQDQNNEGSKLKKDTEVSAMAGQNADRFVNNPNENRKVDLKELAVKEIVILQQVKTMSKGENTAVVVKIPETLIKEVQKNWEKFIKNKTKSKVQNTLDETWISATTVSSIYQDPINIYSKIIQTPDGVDISAFFEINGAFITAQDNDKMTAAGEYMRTFAIRQYKLAIENQLKTEEKNLKTMKQELTKLQKENERLHKGIKVNESNIINTESDIQINASDQVRKATEVEKQKQAKMDVAGDKEQEKLAKKALKERERERKKLQNKNQDMHKNIAKYKAEIEKSKRAIQLNLDQQSIENEAIKKQMLLVRAVKNQLVKIK